MLLDDTVQKIMVLKHVDKPPKHTLREKRSYSELFWSVFSRIRTEYGEIRSISPYSVRMKEKYGPE